MDSLLLNCIPVQNVPLFLTNSNVLLTVSTLKHVISLLKGERQTPALSQSYVSFFRGRFLGHIWDLVSNSSMNGGWYHPLAKIGSPYSSLHPGSTKSKQIYSKLISPFQLICAILTANPYRKIIAGFSCLNFLLCPDEIWFWQVRKVHHLCYRESGGDKTNWISELLLSPGHLCV